jgi:MinD-like ATPase involved in chromosome partitioning or flagellar assembly
LKIQEVNGITDYSMIYHGRLAAFSLLNLMGILMLSSTAYGVNQQITEQNGKNTMIRFLRDNQQKSGYHFQGSENRIMKDHGKVCLNKKQLHLQNSFLPLQKECSCLAFFSSHPGAGKTFLSLGLAKTLAKLGHPVLLLDLAGNESSLKSLLQPTSTISADDLVLNTHPALQSEIITLDSNFDFLGFTFSLPKTIPMEGYFIQNLLKQLYELNCRYDFFIFDTPTGMNELNLALLQTKTSGIFVSTADAETLFDTYTLLKAVYPHLSKPDIHLIINRVLDTQSGEEAHQNLRYALHHFLNQDIKLLAMVPLDGEVQFNGLQSQALPACSPALIKIQQIARSLAGEQPLSQKACPLVYLK